MKNTILETVLQANHIVSKSKFANNPNAKFWVLFDKEMKAYWAEVTPIDPYMQVFYDIELEAIDSFHIKVFNFEDVENPFGEDRIIAESLFHTKKTAKQKVGFLDMVFVRKESCANKGIGKELFSIMEYLTYKTNAKTVTGNLKPFSYVAKPNLIQIYKQLKYKPQTKDHQNYTIEKKLNPKAMQETQERFTPFPSPNKTFMVAVPKKVLVHSDTKTKTTKDNFLKLEK